MKSKESEILDEYNSALDELTINSKPIINALTMLAEENKHNAHIISQTIDDRIESNNNEMKLPVLYLKDSILKNVGGAYIKAFSKNLFKSFCTAFNLVDDQNKQALVHLFNTWKGSELFSQQLLQKIEVRMNSIWNKK